MHLLRCIIIVIFFTFCASQVDCFEVSYYLSINGSDSWDGTSFEHIQGTNEGPWKTLSHAISQIRKVRPPNQGFSVFLNILPGTYFLSETLRLDERDPYLFIQPYYPNSESKSDVIISGGLQIAQNVLELYDNKIQTITYKGSCGEAFIGNQRLIPARSPNGMWQNEEILKNIAVGPYNTIKELLIESDTCKRNSTRNTGCPDENRNGFIFDGELYTENWEDLDQTKILVFQSWIAEYAKIANITKHGKDWKVLFQDPLQADPIGAHAQESGWRFLFYNNIALLDEPGEYVCVEKENGLSELSFIAPVIKEVDMMNQDDSLIVSQLGVMIHMHNANHITMNQLKFQHSSSENTDGYNWGKHSGIQVYDSNDITFQYCEFSHIGLTGIFLRDSSQVTITRSLFFDVGYHAILALYKGSPDMHDLQIDNNKFQGYGMTSYWSPACMWVGGYENIIIRNNEVSFGPWTGIQIKAHKSDGIKKGAVNNYVYKISFNDVHDIGLGILNDYGGIKVNAGDADCNTRNETYLEEYCYTYAHVFNNRISRIKAFHNGANCIYSDDGSSKNTFENNLLYGEGGNALYHHCGIENLSKNNFIHRTASSKGQIDESPDRYGTVWASCEDNDRGHSYPQEYENQRNIYLLDDVEDFAFARAHDRFYDSSPNFHHNLYWSLAPGDAKKEKLYPGKCDWFEWQENGNDTNSIWEDPLFEDPINHVYELKENSPAWTLGIKQIRLDNFGPVDNNFRMKRNTN